VKLDDGTYGKYAPYTPDDSYDYRFHTPYSWTFSAAGVLGSNAIVSLDYEIKDYRSMNLRDQSVYDSFDDINGQINSNFKPASTLRAGFEYRFTPQFSGRLGYSWMQNPYEKTFKNNEKEVVTTGTIPHYTIDNSITNYSVGLGYRFTPNFYMDLACVVRSQKEDLYAFSNFYEGGNEPTAKAPKASLKSNATQIALTFGYKF
jgi:long-subunit fatty acid transport protein